MFQSKVSLCIYVCVSTADKQQIQLWLYLIACTSASTIRSSLT